MNKKVVFLINSLTNGGAERVVSNLITDFVKDGYNIELICLEKDNFYQIDKNIKVTYLSDFTGKESYIRKLFMIFILAIRLRKYIKNNNINLVQSHLFRANYVNILSKLFGSKHIVHLVSAVSAKSKYSDNSLGSKINLFLINHLYKYADLLIFKANAMKDEYLENFNLTNKSMVINNPINIHNIELLKIDNKGINFKFNKNIFYIISVGRFHRHKRQIDLINAFIKLEKNYSNLEIIFLGEGETKQELVNYVINKKLNSKIHFLGNVNNPYYYLYHSNIYVSSSISEGFPNSLIEAMVCELPVISTDCKTGPREILAPNTDHKYFIKNNLELAEYGILLPNKNIRILEEAISLLIKDKNIYKKYKKKGKIRSYDFSIEKIRKKYEKALNENSN